MRMNNAPTLRTARIWGAALAFVLALAAGPGLWRIADAQAADAAPAKVQTLRGVDVGWHHDHLQPLFAQRHGPCCGYGLRGTVPVDR